jgi:DmsE family decaheme c-type cytochrome
VAAGGGRGRYIVNPRQDPAACLTCHLDVRSAFSLPHHHPVLQGQMTCVACHDPHGMDIVKPAGGLAMARLNEACSPCHKEQARPWIFEHEAMRDGCTACHDPHGSLNAKLLLAPDANLCLRCHAQVQGPAVPSGEIVIGTVNHTLLLRQGTCWSSGCHTAVHGSDVNPHLMY